MNTLVDLATLAVMANGLTRSGFIDWFAGTMSTHLEGFSPNATVIVLVLGVLLCRTTCLPACLRTPPTRMPVILAVGKGIPGVPMGPTVLSCCVYRYHGCLTPYATGSGVIIYGCGYVKSKDYWRLGAILV
ncbi:anion permease [Escherichia coli]